MQFHLHSRKMFLTINLLFISTNIFESKVVWNIGSFAAGVCAVSGSARKAEPLYFRNPCYWVANRLHIHQVLFLWKTVLLCYSEIHLLNAVPYCVSRSLSLGNPPAFASGLGVWQVKPCCDTGGVNLLLLFCTQNRDSKLIHALFSGFTTSEVLLHLSRLHLIPPSGAAAFSHLPGVYKGFNITGRVCTLLCSDLSGAVKACEKGGKDSWTHTSAG